MINVVNEIDMQGVPLSVFPITFFLFFVDAGYKIVAFICNDLVGIGAVGQGGYKFLVLIVNLALRGEKQHRAFALRLNPVVRFVALA